MTPRRRLRWGAVPVEPRMTLGQAAARIDAEYADALRVLADETAAAFNVPPELMPLAWFRCGDLVVCAHCRTEVQVGPNLLRCPDCGRMAVKPAGGLL